MSDWSDQGLPLPQRSGYGYSADPGMMRTSFPTAHPRQKLGWKNTRKIFGCNFLLTHAELKVAESFIQSSGFSWFTISLYSGTSTDLIDHTVRFTEEPKISLLGKGYYSLAASLETQFAIDSPDLTSIPCLDPIQCIVGEADDDPC